MGRYTKKDASLFIVMVMVMEGLMLYWMSNLYQDHPLLAVIFTAIISIFYAGLVLAGIDIYNHASE